MQTAACVPKHHQAYFSVKNTFLTSKRASNRSLQVKTRTFLRPLLKQTNPTHNVVVPKTTSKTKFVLTQGGRVYTFAGFTHSFRVEKRVFHEKITLRTRACLPNVFFDGNPSRFQSLPKSNKNGRFWTL